MGEHRRRAQRSMLIEAQEEAQMQLEEQTAEPVLSPAQSAEPAAPRRRRRAQPPQQITQKIPKVSVPEDAQIPRLPVIEELETEKKRYIRTAKKPKHTGVKDETAATQRGEQAAKTIKTCAETGSAVMKNIGGVLLLAAMLLAQGAKKLYALILQLIGLIKSRLAQREEKADDEPDVVLEAIRPQDYHGRGAQHAAQAERKPQRQAELKKKEQPAFLQNLPTQQMISAALVIVALVSLWQIGSILLRTFRTTRLNAQLSQRYASMGGNELTDEQEAEETAFAVYDGEETPAPTPQPTPTPEPEQREEVAAGAKTTPEPDKVTTTKYHHMGGDALPEMEALYNENRDLVAWINIPDVIDLPVVYRDNDYYLKRDFYKQKNTAGTIFLDENHPFKEKSQNLLLHGHNMKDGTMFGRLTQYIYDRTYIKNHPFINLSTLWRKEQYVIFAVLDVSLDPREEAFFNYFTHNKFSSDAEFTSYIRQLQLRSMFAIPIDVEPTDALLTLSTCLEDNRLVIVARRLREGETRAELRQRIHTTTRQ